MQFLEPSPKERRSLWIENFWLLLLRMGLLACLVFALARPWFQSTWLAQFTATRTQDVAIIVDGSYSLERVVGNRTLGDDVRKLTRQVLDQLDASDAVQIYDARETPQTRLAGYVRDRGAARDALLDLPTPTGSSNLIAALNTAARDLLQTGNLDREIVVITDGQRRPWDVEDLAAWQTFDGLRQQARVPPRVWVVEASTPADPPRNLSIGPIELSRELAMPGTQIRLRTPIRSTGSAAPVACDVSLEINGVRSPSHSTTVRVPGDGSASVELSVVLDRPGCHVLAVSIDAQDDLPADDRAYAVVEVGGGWPVLLVDGSSPADASRRETFFAMAAFDAGDQGWLVPTQVSVQDWDVTKLADYSAVVLANVPPLSDEQVAALDQFVTSGGGVLVTLGDQTTPTSEESPTNWDRWLPVNRIEIAGSLSDDSQATTITPDSLELPWQERFRRQRTAGFCDVRYQRWWKVALPQHDGIEAAEQSHSVALFTSGDPCLVWERRGEGAIAVWTSSLDADWNALPSKPDYVPWWHEVLFALLEPAARRNVPVGQPLSAMASPGQTELTGRFLGPLGVDTPGDDWKLGSRIGKRLPAARFPGVYLFVPQSRIADQRAPDTAKLLAEGVEQAFAVEVDVDESDLTPLSDADRESLSSSRPLRFIQSPDELKTAWLGESARTEIADLLLYVFIGFLVIESLMTRRMVGRGSGIQPPTE
ncbi:MAG: hypothetical protein B7Z55_06325 [Planctomycetales bacterium 12-60-4]|nr:MAG: hypothetical protein B7Z55_06325 [Planctomycetales bacterium 12-60-4]